MKIQKSLKFASGHKTSPASTVRAAETSSQREERLDGYDNVSQNQELLKRLQKAKRALKVNEILPL